MQRKGTIYREYDFDRRRPATFRERWVVEVEVEGRRHRRRFPTRARAEEWLRENIGSFPREYSTWDVRRRTGKAAVRHRGEGRPANGEGLS